MFFSNNGVYEVRYFTIGLQHQVYSMAGQDASYSHADGFGRGIVRLGQDFIFLDKRREKGKG